MTSGWSPGLALGSACAALIALGCSSDEAGGAPLGPGDGTASHAAGTTGDPLGTAGAVAAGGESAPGASGAPAVGTGGGAGADQTGTAGGQGETPVPVPGPVGGWEDAPASCGPLCVRVRNYCPFPLWIHAAGSSGVLEPDNAMLETGASVDYPTPDPWSAARVTAFKGGPREAGGQEIEKAEMTLAEGLLNYNATYVDWVGLPLEIQGVGAGCTPNEHVTGCWAPVDQILNGCPHPDLQAGDRCMAPRSFCMNPDNLTHEICTWLDDAIDACVAAGLGCPANDGAPEVTGTPAVYGCNSGTWYGDNELECAALNRGMGHAPDNDDPSEFYQNEPYNIYSAWSHSVCPKVYSFSYDDVHAFGGFKACRGEEMRITFCPGDLPE